jgi:DNA end-binding protein Ku
MFRGDVASHKRERESPLPHTQPQDRKSRRQPICRFGHGQTRRRRRRGQGYERGEGDYVLLEDDELEAVALESARTIDIDIFAAAGSIDRVWYDKPHYLTPNDEVGKEAFCVIRDAMQATQTVGISRVVLYRRERAVMLEPRDKGIVLWTLRYGDEVRPPKDYFANLGAAAPEPKLMSLVTTLIAERKKPWSPTMVRDPVQAKLLTITAAKGRNSPKPPQNKAANSPPTNVVNIMDALRKSLSQEKKAAKR